MNNLQSSLPRGSVMKNSSIKIEYDTTNNWAEETQHGMIFVGLQICTQYWSVQKMGTIAMEDEKSHF